MLGGTNCFWWCFQICTSFVPPLYLLGEVQKDIFVPTNGRYKNVQLKRTNQGAVFISVNTRNFYMILSDS
jgi:hypothetical protein